MTHIPAAALLCAALANAGAAEFSATVSTLPAGGTLASQPSHTSVSNYGHKPQVLLNANPDNSYDVAWHLNSLSKIRIQPFDSAGKALAAVQPDDITGAKNLVGMARIPDDGGFAVGYAKDSPHSGSAYEFWVTRVDGAGKPAFTKMVFGDANKDVVDAKGEPGTFSSGRIGYNPASKKLCLYVGHTMRWNDGVRHQAGFMAFMGLDGTFGVANGWYSSHNFDMRLLRIGSDWFTLAHGDAYPRALGFAKWSDAGAKGSQAFDKQWLKIPGGVGDNKTSTQLGGFVAYPDGTFGAVFATANGRNAFDVGYRQLSAKGDTLSLHWLTQYPAGTFAIFPRIARHGENALILWEEVTGNAVAGIQAAIVAPAGTSVQGKTPLPDKALRLTPYHDVSALPNGKFLWAVQKGNDSISVVKLTVTPGAPVRQGGPGSKAAMRLELRGDRLALEVARAGVYRVRQFDGKGKLIRSETENLDPGLHAFALAGMDVSFVEARSGSEVRSLRVDRAR